MKKILLASHENGHIDSLTGLRAVAAGLVVFSHLIPNDGKGVVSSVLEEFNVGVSIFFVLSGFLITYRYYEKQENSFVWFYNYTINRIARVYPMYILLTTYTFGLIFLAARQIDSSFFKIYILNITFLRGFFADYVYSGIPQGWSLTVEECFYFSAPLIFFFSKKIPVGVQSLCIFCFGVFIFFIFKDTNFHGFMNSLKAISITTFFGRIFEFAAGVIMALSVLRNKTYKFATMTGLFFFISTFSAQAFINYQFQKFAIQTIGGFVINSIVISFSVAMFIYGIMKENTIFSRMLSTRLMVLLGKSSYTLYLLHWSMTGYLIRRFISSNFIVEILITYVFSIFLWHLIEEPCNKFIKKFRILQPERNSL